MTVPPDVRELVGDDGPPEELERLRRVHELLVQAGPPAELSPALARPPAPPQATVVRLWRRRPATLLGVAAAAVLAAFVIGYAVGGGGGGGFSAAFSVPMRGAGPTPHAEATVKVGHEDAAGNWPLQLVVRGLPQLPPGGWYELDLTRQGKVKESCGTFRVRSRKQETKVSMTVPYELRSYTGWAVTRHVPGRPSASFLLRTERV